MSDLTKLHPGVFSLDCVFTKVNQVLWLNIISQKTRGVNILEYECGHLLVLVEVHALEGSPNVYLDIFDVFLDLRFTLARLSGSRCATAFREPYLVCLTLHHTRISKKHDLAAVWKVGADNRDSSPGSPQSVILFSTPEVFLCALLGWKLLVDESSSAGWLVPIGILLHELNLEVLLNTVFQECGAAKLFLDYWEHCKVQSFKIDWIQCRKILESSSC